MQQNAFKINHNREFARCDFEQNRKNGWSDKKESANSAACKATLATLQANRRIRFQAHPKTTYFYFYFSNSKKQAYSQIITAHGLFL